MLHSQFAPLASIASMCGRATMSMTLWPTIIATPNAPIAAVGSRTSPASTTIDQPIAQITPASM